MKIKKLLLKIIIFLICLIFLIIVGLHFTLVYFISSNNVKDKIVSTLQEQLATEVKIESISASLADFTINNLEIKINNNDFAYIKKAYIHFSLKALIFGKIRVNRISINNLTVYIEKDENGKFNFEELLNSPMFAAKEETAEKKEEPKDEEESIIDLLLHKTQLQNICVYYNDKQGNIDIKLTDTYFDIDNFGFNEQFKLTFCSKLDISAGNMELSPVNLASTIFITLNPNELDKANINISDINTKYKDFVLSIKGNVTNLKKPNAILDINFKDLSSEVLEGICETPQFYVPLINIKTDITTDIDNSKIDVSSFNLNLLDSTITADGYLNYAKMNYNFNVIINLLLDKLQSVTSLIEEYKPTGQIKSELSVSDKEIKGNILLNNIGAFTPQLGDFTNINSEIYLDTINNIKIPTLTGELNKYPFKANLSYLLAEDHGDISIDFKADKFIGKMAQETKKEETNKKEKSTDSASAKTEEENKSSFPPLNIKANCNINFLDIPFLRANKVLFNMDLSNVTQDLNSIHGYLKLDLSNGIIKDIYKLTEANALTKSLFLSLKIISNVINALNVLDLLSSIGSVFSSNDDTAAKENEDIVKHQKIDGQIDFNSFVTKLNFSNGNTDFDKCSFVSKLLSFRVTGNMNFKENAIDMTVFTAPGEHEVDGIMPLTMKIGGTMDEPKGSLSLLGSVSALVGDMLTKNVVADKLKKGFSALFGLKKNDEQGNEIKEEVNTSSSTAVISTTTAATTD